MNILHTLKKTLSQLVDFLTKKEKDIILYDDWEWSLTLRELLLSIIIIAVFLIIGFFATDKITNWVSERNQVYLHAVEIDNPEIFDYSIRTEVGNAFVHGDLIAVDPVSVQNKGPYLYIYRRTEKYTQHTRVIHHSDGKRSWTTTEIYWTWDYYGSAEWHCTKIKFCNKELDYGAIDLPGTQYLCTESTGYHLRDKYYIIPAKNTGVLFTTFKDKTLTHGSWFNVPNTKVAKEQCIDSGMGWYFGFWILWVALMMGSVGVFVYMDNQWLNN